MWKSGSPWTRRRYAVALAVILTLGAIFRLWNLARGVPALNSDEAVVGLMAIRLLHGEWTTFYWAQDYMGSLEAILAAPLIRLLGATALALRLPSLLASLGVCALVADLGARLYSRAVGLVVALLLALGAPFFLVMSARTLGGYMETLLLGVALVALSLRGANGDERGRWPWVALAGLLAGLGLWTDPLIVPYLLVAGLICWMRRRRDLLRWPNGPILAAGAILGAFPAILYNITKPFSTLAAIVGVSALRAGPPHAHGHLDVLSALTAIPPRLATELTVALPVIMGAPYGGFQATGFTPADFYRLAATYPLQYAISLALLTLAALMLFSASMRLIRRSRTSPWRGSSASATRRQGQLALLLLGACYLAGFAFVRDFAAITSPRYLTPVYTLTPLVVGEGWLLVRRWRQLRTYTAFAVLAIALIWNITGVAALTPTNTAAIEDGQYVSSNDQALLALLSRNRLHTVITSGYWIGYRLCYESDEAIIPVMRRPDGSWGYNRYQPYLTRGLSDPAPAYIELTDTPQAGQLHVLVQSGKLADYHVTTIGNYVVALPPTPSGL